MLDAASVTFGTTIMQNVLQEPTPLLTKMTDMEIIMEDSLDGGPPSVGSGDIPAAISTPSNSGTATPISGKKVRFWHGVWTIPLLVFRAANRTLYKIFHECALSALRGTRVTFSRLSTERQEEQDSDRLHFVLARCAQTRRPEQSGIEFR